MPTTILDGETYEQAKHRRFTEEAEYAKRLQHTPGPWHIMKPLESNGYVWVNPMGGMCGEIATAWPISQGSAEANARLIAAAPDLLEALQGFLVMTEGHFMEPQQKAAKAAIAKALGDTLL